MFSSISQRESVTPALFADFDVHVLSEKVVFERMGNQVVNNFSSTKKEVMLISNIFNDYNSEIKFDTNVLKIVDAHKHLGVILSSNNKWAKHIDLIIDSASKQIGFLRKLNYKLSKVTLNKLYLTYIRPLLEYASEVWDGCSITDSNRIEKVQLHAARIITDLPIFASLSSLYFKTGWVKLDERRISKMLALMYKIQ